MRIPKTAMILLKSAADGNVSEFTEVALHFNDIKFAA